ncbi:MAG: NUDIX hydrolase [Actinomycetales bacterium]
MTPSPTAVGDGLPPVLAAGGVVWRGLGDDLQVALVHRPRYDDWSLPKGKRDRGEHLVVTAVREIWEETGARVRLGASLGTITYPVLDGAGRQRDKTVHFWSAAFEEGDFTPNDEVDELAWCSVPAARRRLTRQAEVDVLDRFAATPPAVTTPFVVLRHAEAVPRDAWQGPDDRRPLSAHGVEQAHALARVLPAFGVLSVVTSAATRTRATVEPYARATRQRPRIDARLGEARLTGTELDSLQDWAAAAAVLCTHRPVIPVLLDELRALAAVPLPPLAPLAPGDFVVTHVDESAARPRPLTWQLVTI